MARIISTHQHIQSSHQEKPERLRPPHLAEHFNLSCVLMPCQAHSGIFWSGASLVHLQCTWKWSVIRKNTLLQRFLKIMAYLNHCTPNKQVSFKCHHIYAVKVEIKWHLLASCNVKLSPRFTVLHGKLLLTMWLSGCYLHVVRILIWRRLKERDSRMSRWSWSLTIITSSS